MKWKVFTAVLAIFGIGLIGGYVFRDFFDNGFFGFNSGENQSKQFRQIGSYTYINPLLECDVAEGLIDTRKENFHSDLEDFVNDLKSVNELSDVAVYFRDLNNGPTFGVNTSDEFFPASLLKVPVMMAYYRWSESEPGLLQVKIQYTEPRDLGFAPTIIPKKQLIPGQAYTIDELIRHMIVYSDNQALYLLSGNLPKENLKDLFLILGVRDEILIDSDAKLTVKEYSSFFRILFNSSYLSRENSEKALALLSQTEFNEGLVAGIPNNVSVSHKFGEAGTKEMDRQLHDCGIVYFPNHPYLACIMTRGRNPEKLKKSIKDISAFIYKKIDEQY